MARTRADTAPMHACERDDDDRHGSPEYRLMRLIVQRFADTLLMKPSGLMMAYISFFNVYVCVYVVFEAGKVNDIYCMQYNTHIIDYIIYIEWELAPGIIYQKGI